MLRPRVTCSIDANRRLLVMRCIGCLDGKALEENFMAHFTTIAEVWNYDHIIDYSRFSGSILAADTERLAASWRDLVEGRDKNSLTAVIINDPLSYARQSISQGLLPSRRMELFARFSEGSDWIKAERRGLL